MFRNRKRKVSPDKKTDKTKKLKVSNKIFRSPSTTKPNSEAKAKLSKLLPDGYDSIILTANTKPDESFEENEAVFGCVRLPILTKEDAMVWVKKFETKTFTSYRTQRTWKKDVNTGLFKRKYICNARNKDVPVQSAAATCKGSIIFTIKDQEEIQANPDYYLRDYPSQVIIHFCHNHKIDPDSYMKNLRPTAELRIIFGTYFAKGHSPFSALICHKCDLHSSYGAEFYNVVSNGAICPSYNWCFHEYEKFFMRKFIEPPEDKLYEKLNEGVIQYNSKWRSECAVISYSPMFVLSICTPLMKSVFRSGFAEELITVRCFSTPKTVPKRQKLILFLCHTPIGSLPFGVVVTFAEDTENVCAGIRALINMFGVTSYTPKTIIIDENALISKSLKKCFPTAQILFNEFQMLQSIWRIIRVVCPNDDEEFQALYNLFLVTLNSSSEEEFNKNFDSLLVYAEKFPKLTNFLKYFKVRSTSYVLYARPKIEFNTDVLNYTDSGTIILQDVSIKYGNFFNIVQLFDFVSKSYVDHYERKLNKIIEGDLKGFFKTNFYVPLSKIADFTCEKISDTEFLVSLNEMKFFVNAELDTCTCQVGVHGGSCVHQYIVEKNLGLVPECYTPLCDDMLGIFKNILKEKNIKPPLPDDDHYSELSNTLESIKSELESVQDADELTDVVSSVCCSEISNFSGMPHDLCPMEEIFLAPPDINESFTDITDEAMSPLILSEFDDNNEESEDFLDDSQQYNRESGELEPIDSLKSTRELKNVQNNVLVDGFPSNLEQSIPTTGYFLNQDHSDNVIIYEYTEDDIKCNNEVEIVEHCGNVDGETLVHLPAEGSIVYTYSGKKQNQVTFYEDEMNESDRKTAEIAEFLTNLPDTNNSNQNIPHYILDKGRVVEQKQTVSNGVVVVRNEEYFTNYEVLENNVLSVVTDATDAFSQNFEATTDSAQDLITSSYEDNNFVMISPNDLFDDNQNAELVKQDNRINVLSSVVIKPPAVSSLKYIPTYNPSFPINLNTVKHKTLRNVKEDSRIRMSEQKTTQPGGTIFIQEPLKSEPRKIVLPMFKKDSNWKEIKSNDENKCNQPYEKDVIKLYCNQSSEKPVVKDTQEETKTLQQEQLLDTAQLEDELSKKNVETLLPHTLEYQSEDDSQEHEEYLIDTEVNVQEWEKETSDSKEMLDYKSKNNSQEFNAHSDDVVQTNDNSALYTGDVLFADCNPEELARNEFVEIVEIDSDGVEELASQDHFSIVPSLPLKQESVQSSFLPISPVKVIPLKNLPSNMMSFKSLSIKNTSLASKCIPLRDFMSKSVPSKVSLPHQIKDTPSSKENKRKGTTMDDSDSNECSSSSEFEDNSDSLDSIGSGIDELSEDELYELQYLWDDTSDESIDEEELEYRKPVTQPTNLSDRTQQKTRVSTSPTLRSDDNSVDDLISVSKSKPNQKLQLPPGITLRPIEKKIDKIMDRTSNKTDEHISQKFDLSNRNFSELINARSKKQVGNKSLSFQIKDKSAESPKTKSQDTGHNERIDSNCGIQEDKGLLSKTHEKIESLNEKQIKNPGVTAAREIKKSVSERPSKSNLSSNNTSSVDNTDHQDRLKTYETVDIIDPLRTANEPKLPIYKLSSEQKNVLAEKRDNIYTNETDSKKKITANKTKHKINTKMMNIKDKALANTLIKLDSLPNILLQPYNQRLGWKNQMQCHLNTNISKGKNSAGVATASNSDICDTVEVSYEDSDSDDAETESLTDSFSVSEFSQHKDNKSISNSDIRPVRCSQEDMLYKKYPRAKTNIVKPLLKKQNENQTFSKQSAMQCQFVHDKAVKVNTPKRSCDLSSDLSKASCKGNKSFDKIQSFKELTPKKLDVAVGRRTEIQNPGSQMGKDIEDLEAILTSDKDVDRNLSSTVNNPVANNTSTANIFQNNDLSFLFDDPRFETVIEEEETLPSPMVAGQGTFDISLRGVGQKEITKKKISSKKNNKRKYDFQEPLPEKMVKYTDHSSLGQCDQKVESEESQIAQLFEEGQNRVITLLVYTGVPKRSTPNTEKANSKKKPFRKILPKPGANLDDNKELLEFSDEKEKKIKETNSLVRQSRRLICSRDVKLKRSMNKGNVSSNDANRTRFRPREVENTINIADPEIKQEITPKRFKDLTTSLPDSLRRNARNETRNAKATPMQNVDLSSKTISNRRVRTRSQNRKTGNLNDDSFLGYMETPSNKEQRQISLRKEKITKTPILAQKKLDKTKDVRNQKQNRHKGQNDISIDKKRRSVPTYSEKRTTDSPKDLTPKKESSNIIQANKKRKQAKEKSHKIDLRQEDKDKYLVKGSVSKLKKSSTFEYPASPILNFESDDLENSITASFLERQPTETDKLVSSTPKRSIGYEDAYKMFLETSNRWSPKTEHDSENDTDRELSWGSRRRTKSVSSPKEQSFDSKKFGSGKMKKSVSWAEGLNIIEYIQDFDTDSDDSEIREITKKRTPREKDRERSILRKHNRITSQPFENTLRRSKSVTTKRESTQIKSRRRSQSYSRIKKSEIRLYVLLERNKDIDRMCFNQRDQNMSCSLRSRGRERRGYKELLHRAICSKYMDT